MRKWYDINKETPFKNQEVWATIINIKEERPPHVLRLIYRGEPNVLDPYCNKKTEDTIEYERWWLDTAFYGDRVIAWMPIEDAPEPYMKGEK